ncbi:MAG: hypothetical protein ACLP8Y_02790 [Thermoplasmata archaeon]
MTLISDILDRYLYKEDVQQLARERGLSASGSKDEIIDGLVDSGRFDPADAVAYLNVRQLRRLCREYRLPEEGDRTQLVETVLEAIWDELEPPSAARRPRRKKAPATAKPSEPGSTQGISRVHPDTSGPWTVVGIVATGCLAALIYLAIAELGLEWGIVASVLAVLATGAGLFLTSHRWMPRLARVFQARAERAYGP